MCEYIWCSREREKVCDLAFPAPITALDRSAFRRSTREKGWGRGVGASLQCTEQSVQYTRNWLKCLLACEACVSRVQRARALAGL